MSATFPVMSLPRHRLTFPCKAVEQLETVLRKAEDRLEMLGPLLSTIRAKIKQAQSASDTDTDEENLFD